MDNPEKLATLGAQNTMRSQQSKNPICVGHQYTQTNTNKQDMSPPTKHWR